MADTTGKSFNTFYQRILQIDDGQIQDGTGSNVTSINIAGTVSASDLNINDWNGISSSLSDLESGISSSEGLWTASNGSVSRNGDVQITGSLFVSQTGSFGEIEIGSSDESLTSFSSSTSNRLTTNESNIADLQTDSASFSTRITDNELTRSIHETDITNLEGTASRNEATASDHETRIDSIEASPGFWTASGAAISRLSDVQISGSLLLTGSIQQRDQTVTNFFSGSVGIGTTSTSRRFQVSTQGNQNALVIADSNGRVGIGTNSLSSVLNVGGDRIILFTGGTGTLSNVGFIDMNGGNLSLNDISQLRFDNISFGARVNISGSSSEIIHIRQANETGLTAYPFVITDSTGSQIFGVSSEGQIAQQNGTGSQVREILGLYNDLGINHGVTGSGTSLGFYTDNTGNGPKPLGNLAMSILTDGAGELDSAFVVSLHNNAATSTEIFRVQSDGQVKITGSLHASTTVSASGFNADSLGSSSFGFVSKTGGSFKIPYPGQESEYDLYHSFVESPNEGQNIYTYTVKATKDDDQVIIDLPDYWQHLNKDPQVWVSPIDQYAGCYGRVNERLAKLIVKCEKVGQYNVLLTGVRKDPLAQEFWNGTKRKK